MIDGHALCVDSKLRSGSGSPWLALGAGCGHCLAVFLCRWHQWLTMAQPVLSPVERCPAPFYPRVGLSLQISNGPRSLISSRQASPLLHHLFPSRLRWDLRSVPLRASSTPASLASWLHLAHPALLIPWLPLAEWGSQSPDAETIRRLAQLVSSSQTSFSFDSSQTSLSDSLC